jgi:hypothetical protein
MLQIFSSHACLGPTYMGILSILKQRMISLFGWLVVDGWRWFVLREEYCWLVAGGRWPVRSERRVPLAGG